MIKDEKLALADKALGKVISKKLLVWVITTGFFIAGMVRPDQWFNITMLWMGGVSAIDVVSKLRKK